MIITTYLVTQDMDICVPSLITVIIKCCCFFPLKGLYHARPDNYGKIGKPEEFHRERKKRNHWFQDMNYGRSSHFKNPQKQTTSPSMVEMFQTGHMRCILIVTQQYLIREWAISIQKIHKNRKYFHHKMSMEEAKRKFVILISSTLTACDTMKLRFYLWYKLGI